MAVETEEIFDVKAVRDDVTNWLKSLRKDELIYIILANLNHINLFARMDSPDNANR